MQRKTDVIFDPPGWWAGSLGWGRGLWVDIWQVGVCVCACIGRGQLNGGPLK